MTCPHGFGGHAVTVYSRRVAKRLNLSLLGGVEVKDASGNSIVLRRQKSRALIAYLGANLGQPLSRAKAAGILWGEMEESRARMNLRQTLRSLNQDLGPHKVAIEVTSEFLRLRPDAATVDITELRAATLRCGKTALDAIGRKYTPFLDGFCVDEAGFDDWAANERFTLETEILAYLETALERVARCEGVGKAAPIAELLVRIDATHEEAHALLAGHHLASGRKDRAARQIAACREALRTVLEIEPGPAIMKLQEKLTASETSSSHHLREEIPTLSVQVGGIPELKSAAQGFRDDLLHYLTRWRSFSTVERSSQTTDFRLKARLDRSDDGGRVVVRLIECASDSVFWGAKLSDLRGPSTGVAESEVLRVAAAAASQIELAASIHRAEQASVLDGLLGRARRSSSLRNRQANAAATSDYLMALELSPHNARALSGYGGSVLFAVTQGWLGQQRIHLRNVSDALEQALQSEPHDAGILTSRSCQLLHSGDIRAAIAHAKQAVDLNPANPFAHAHLGVAQLCDGHAAKSVECLMQATQIAPTDDLRSLAVRVWLSRALIGAGEYEKAYEIALSQLGRIPDYGPAYIALATAMLHMGDAAEARGVMVDCADRLPGYIAFRRNHNECADERLKEQIDAALYL